MSLGTAESPLFQFASVKDERIHNGEKMASLIIKLDAKSTKKLAVPFIKV